MPGWRRCSVASQIAIFAVQPVGYAVSGSDDLYSKWLHQAAVINMKRCDESLTLNPMVQVRCQFANQDLQDSRRCSNIASSDITPCLDVSILELCTHLHLGKLYLIGLQKTRVASMLSV